MAHIDTIWNVDAIGACRNSLPAIIPQQIMERSDLIELLTCPFEGSKIYAEPEFVL